MDNDDVSSSPTPPPTAGTLTLSTQRDGTGPEATAAFLFRGLACDDPYQEGARLALDAVDEIRLGRGETFRTRLHQEGRTRVLDIELPDRRASSKHARITRTLGSWVVEDLESKNGTLRNAQPCRRATLEDGDLIEVGRSFFLFRDALAIPRDVAVPAASREAPHGSLVPALSASLADMARVAESMVPVLVRGESGTGKELAARSVHAHSGRKGPFVAVNCGGLTETLVEGELFGSTRGAYSGAVADRPGLVRAADGGTLFLDEIAELPPVSQAALLRVLQEREVVPVGATRPVAVDFRLVSATHRDLHERVRSGSFREDLLARVSGFTVELPPLRERLEDLPVIVSALLRELKAPNALRLSPNVVRFLYRHRWPLNVRELEHALGSAVALCADGELDASQLAKAMGAQSLELPAAEPSRAPLSDADRALRETLIALLRAHEGNVSAIARHMGKARMQIQRWLKRFDLDPSGYRKS